MWYHVYMEIYTFNHRPAYKQLAGVNWQVWLMFLINRKWVELSGVTTRLQADGLWGYGR